MFVDATRDYATRARTYERAMARMSRAHPAAREAALFHALALQVVAPPADKTYAYQLRSARILEKIFAEQPDHPGAAHYIIHAYDSPSLAARALPAARRYGEIAQSMPHALHMPSHTFTQLGMWEESVRANRASEAAARAMGELPEWFHALDYLIYAHLQLAQDVAAREAVERLRRPKDVDPTDNTIFYAAAAGPARYTVERRRWADAAVLEVVASPMPYVDALTVFARALGAARSADVASARRDVERLETLRDAAGKPSSWGSQIEVQRRAAAAWIALAEGKAKDAEGLMRSAATLEDASDKSSVTPSVIVPARELLGDMLRELKQPAAALKEYETSIRREPNRFNGTYGAARAAELAGNRAKARKYYEQLLTLGARADTERPELREAKAYLGN
jgi:tetratricopeptide (TPR) repeat protein